MDEEDLTDVLVAAVEQKPALCLLAMLKSFGVADVKGGYQRVSPYR